MPQFYLTSKHRPGCSVPLRKGMPVEWSGRPGRDALVLDIEYGEYGFVSMVDLQYPRGRVAITASQLKSLRATEAIIKDGAAVDFAITAPMPPVSPADMDEDDGPIWVEPEPRVNAKVRATYDFALKHGTTTLSLDDWLVDNRYLVMGLEASHPDPE